MYILERNLSRWLTAYVSPERGKAYREAAERRKNMIDSCLWLSTEGRYADFDTASGNHTSVRSLAEVFPLFAGIASKVQAERVAQSLRNDFLYDGGLVTTLSETGEQWDFPAGWAPLQWTAVKGLERYGYYELAAEIRNRWVALNRRVYDVTGYMFEKYDVVNKQISSDLGEYPVQIGFGWTNGVLLDFLAMVT